jgi:ketosteroid isomerase-like protein
MNTTIQAEKFAKEWIASWNSHDMDNIMQHYSEDVEINTPMIRLATGLDADSLKGKSSVREYWERALAKLTDLRFELIDVTKGVNSIALYYKTVMNKTSVEVMFFNEEGKVNKIFAHYS